MPSLLNSLFHSVDKYDYDITNKGFIRKRKDYKLGPKQNQLSEGEYPERWHLGGKERSVPSEYGAIHSRNGSKEPTRRMEEHRRREPRSEIKPEHPSSANHRSGRMSHIPQSQVTHCSSTKPRRDKGMHRSEMAGRHQPSESRFSQRLQSRPTLRSQCHKQQPGLSIHRSQMR
ncbi:MAG: hypothetical protein Q9167_003206 [Letrouitia subvulpina]